MVKLTRPHVILREENDLLSARIADDLKVDASLSMMTEAQRIA